MFCDLKPEKAVISYTEWLEKASQCGCPEDRRCDPSRIDGSARNSSIPARCESLFQCNYDQDWVEPDVVQYREIKDWPHLNNCVKTLEVLNIGGTNVLGEFVPFLLLHAPKLRSLGEWINTMIYGLEILRKIPGYQNISFPQIEEFSYSTDRNYFCQPYIGFVPESIEFRNVRKEMVR